MNSSDSNHLDLYEAIDVWRKLSPTEFVCYRCFRNILTNRYVVQSADFFTLPLDTKQMANLSKQYLELLTEQAPDERSESFDSLIEAIKAHEADHRRRLGAKYLEGGIRLGGRPRLSTFLCPSK
jgi:hypothetical protein